MTHHDDHAAEGHGGHAHHPPYMKIFAWLSALTIIEIFVPFVFHANKAIAITILVAIAIWKMNLILRYFMHLKFDALVLGLIAATPGLLALIMASGLLMDWN